jgi:hypothetical protein
MGYLYFTTALKNARYASWWEKNKVSRLPAEAALSLGMTNVLTLSVFGFAPFLFGALYVLFCQHWRTLVRDDGKLELALEAIDAIEQHPHFIS